MSYKYIILALVITPIILITGCSSKISQEDYDALKTSLEDNQKETESYKEKVNDLEEQLTKFEEENKSLGEENQSLIDKNKELQSKVDEAAPWFEMKEEERKAEEEKLEAEKKAKEIEEARKTYSKYISLIESKKSYYDMNEDERKLISEWIDSEYSKMPVELQDEYKELYTFANDSRAEGLELIKADEEAKKAAEEQAKKEAEAQKYNTGLTYEDLARNPNENAMKLVTFSGKIVQVMKGTDYTQYRMAIDDDIDKVVLIEVDNSLLINGNILEDDYVTIKGVFISEMEYTTVMGDKRTIPAIVVDEFEFKK